MESKEYCLLNNYSKIINFSVWIRDVAAGQNASQSEFTYLDVRKKGERVMELCAIIK